VRSTDGGTFFHLAAWQKVLTNAAVEPRFLTAKRGGQVVGVLPLARLRSLLFGDSLVSTPFCVVGGALAAADAPEAISALEDAAVQLAEQLRVRHLELRSATRTQPDWPEVDHYALFERELFADDEKNLLAVPRKQRAVIRQALARPLKVTIANDPDRMFRLYAHSVRELGSPTYSRQYFADLLDTFGDECEVAVVEHQGRDVVAVMTFFFGDKVLPYYAGAVREARGLGAYDRLYYDLMCRSGHAGKTCFDFGRSVKGTGSWAFKKNWGFAPVPLHYQFRLLRTQSLPDKNPNSRANRLLTNIYKRLPMALTNRIGPRLARHFT